MRAGICSSSRVEESELPKVESKMAAPSRLTNAFQVGSLKQNSLSVRLLDPLVYSEISIYDEREQPPFLQPVIRKPSSPDQRLPPLPLVLEQAFCLGRIHFFNHRPRSRVNNYLVSVWK